jgi:phosphatidylinositol kinase/protein kinase (PI-3  family)
MVRETNKDDLRQDAVISSVFNIMNKLLTKKPETQKRNLKIRTYKIIPVASQAGVVHWVNGTIPLGEILMKAHQQTLQKWSLQTCRQKMKAEHDKKSSTQASKLVVFLEIEKHTQPVLGSIFFDLYRDPKIWYINRLRFIKSVACSSMAGWVMGIGDRHSQNLLFDKTTGEIIHIDLGIAFDQGKLLSTPELVPFRLTRNLVDAMGITTFHGVFKKGCEESLKLFREESEILFTLLDVFRYDPLHTWTISPLKLKKMQQEVEEEGNDEAGIALFGIRRKLERKIGVECQVQELINMAIDPVNLSKMYPGWQSWI